MWCVCVCNQILASNLLLKFLNVTVALVYTFHELFHRLGNVLFVSIVLQDIDLHDIIKRFALNIDCRSVSYKGELKKDYERNEFELN